MSRDTDNPTPSFEEAMAELERIVDALEKGDLSLEASLSAFERGMHVKRVCEAALAAAEQKIRVLTEKPGGPDLVPFDPHA